MYLHFSFSSGSWCNGGAWCNGACCGSWCNGAIRLDIADPTEAATDSWRCPPPCRSSSDRHSPFSLSGSMPAASASLYTLRWMLKPCVNVLLSCRACDFEPFANFFSKQQSASLHSCGQKKNFVKQYHKKKNKKLFY